MPFDASGNFTRLRGNDSWKGDAQAGTRIKSDLHDINDNDLASGLSFCLTKDGRTQPTADLPMAGHRLTNLGDPTSAKDAVTRDYVDAIRTFSTAITIGGSSAEARLKFTGGVGPWGVEFPDLFFGVKAADGAATPPTVNRFIWNDKVDATGRDLMELTEAGVLRLLGQTDELPPRLDLFTKADGSGGPMLRFQHSSPTPAALDELGGIDFTGKNAAAADFTYGRIVVTCADPTTGSEDGTITIQNAVAGALTNRLVANAAGVTVGGTLAVGTTLAVGGPGMSNILTGTRISDVSPYIWHAQPAALVVDYGGPASDYGSVWSQRLTGGNATPCLWLWGSGPSGSVQTTSSGTTIYATTSDIRTKGAVVPAENARALIDALQVIEYQPDPVVRGAERHKFLPHEGIKPAAEDPIYIGLSAQQAYEVYPPAVIPAPTMPSYDASKAFGDEGFMPWMIDHSKFVPMLIAALQEANARIDQLEARIAALEAAP